MTAAVSVVVVAYGHEDLLDACLRPIARDLPVTVVDNACSETCRTLCHQLGVRYLDPGRNLGFGGGVNRALRDPAVVGADAVLLLNPDARVSSTDVAGLRRAMLAAPGRVGCASPALAHPGTGAPQRVVWPFPSPSRQWLIAAGLGRVVRAPDFLVGAVLMLDGRALAEVGGFDERYFLYAEETDWQRRATDLGWRPLYVPEVRVEHLGGATSDSSARQQAYFHAGTEIYVRKWFGPVGWLCYRAAVLCGDAVRWLVGGGGRRAAAGSAPGDVPARPGEVPRRASRADPVTTRSVTHVVATDNFAGVERYVATVAAATTARGWTVRVLGGRERDLRQQLPADVAWRPAPDLPRAMLALARAPRSDVVHVHMTKAEVAAAVVRRGSVTVATRHFAATRGSSVRARRAGAWAARHLDLELAISDTVRAASGAPRMPVLLNGVPNSDVPRCPRPVVVVAQRLEAEKQTADAVAAFAASGLRDRGWTLEIYGEGGERAAVEAAIREHGLTAHARLLGFARDMPAVLARAGVFLAVAPHEPFGLVVAEAMAAGVPVVAAAGGGHLETVGAAPAAWTYRPGDTAAGGRLLRELAVQDDAAREEYGAGLRAWQRRHLSVESHTDLLIEHYEGQLRRPSRRHRG